MNGRKLCLLGLLATLLGSTAVAQTIDVKADEFAAWPEYCRARHVNVPPGSSSEFAITYPKAKVGEYRQLLGPATFERVHHYCWGLVWIARAQRETDQQSRMRMLDQARGEVIFTYAGLPQDSMLIAPSLFALSQICVERGEDACGLNYLEQAVKLRPEDASTYSALAVFYRHQKKLELARDILLQGDQAVGGKSAEIHYNLGLIYLELGDADAALPEAHRAYELGYPLPGLRNKLRKLGKWQVAGSPSNGS